MGSERSIVATVTVPVSQERAFEFLSDTSRYAEWVEDTLEVSRTDGPAEQGSTYDEINRVAGPLKGRSRWTVTEHESPRRSLHTGEGIPIARAMSVEFQTTPLDEATTEIVFTFRYEPAFGPLGSLLASVGLHRQVAAGFKKTAESFRRLVERESQAAAAARS